jgi:hypothetical protein
LPSQYPVEAHSLSSAHIVVHAGELQRYGAHSCVCGVGVTHVPLPLHVDCFVNDVPAHEAPLHTVPLAYLRQAPAPSHIPSSPHVEAASLAHSESGSVPTFTAAHWPLLAPVLPAEHA